MKNQLQKGNVLIIVLVFLNILVLLSFGYWFYQEQIVKKTTYLSMSPLPTPAKSLEPSSIPVKVATDSSEIKNDYDLIIEAFSKKYDKPLSAITLTLNKNTGTHAQGGVKFEGELSGAWFLCHKGAGGWAIVADGNGTISCSLIEPYDFPVDMVPECVDDEGNLVER